jgi:hypothetical protein
MLKARFMNMAQRSIKRVAPRPTTTAPTRSSIVMEFFGVDSDV